MLDYSIAGVEQALANLRKVAGVVNDERIGDNAAAALEPVAEEARRLVPVDSGDLRDTIGISNDLGDFGATGSRVGVAVGVLRAGGTLHVFYAHFIEFGTVTQRAQPFLAPAVFKHRDLVFEVLGVKVGQDIIGAL